MFHLSELNPTPVTFSWDSFVTLWQQKDLRQKQTITFPPFSGAGLALSSNTFPCD